MTILGNRPLQLSNQFPRHRGRQGRSATNPTLLHFTAQVGKLLPSNNADVSVPRLDRRAGAKAACDNRGLRQRGALLESIPAHEEVPQ